MLISFFLMYSRRKRPKSSNKYSRNIFDPQYMYQHGLTRRQAKGVVLQPKTHNLENPEPRIDENILQKYQSTLLQYNRLGTVKMFKISLNLNAQAMADPITLDYNVLIQSFETLGVSIDKVVSAFIPTFRITKSYWDSFPTYGSFIYHFFDYQVESEVTATDVQTDERNDLTANSCFGQNLDTILRTFSVQYPKLYYYSDNGTSGYVTNVLSNNLSKDEYPLLWKYIDSYGNLPFVTYNIHNVPNSTFYMTFALGFNGTSTNRKIEFDIVAHIVN